MKNTSLAAGEAGFRGYTIDMVREYHAQAGDRDGETQNWPIFQSQPIH
jgi:hypothetical protein